MNALGSSPCEAAGQQAQIGEKEPGCGAGNGGLEVLGETATAAQPGKGALDDPSSGQELEAFDARWPLDDLDGPRAAVVDGGEQLGAAVDAIGEDVAQAGEASAQRTQQRHGAMRILDIGLVQAHGEQKAFGIGDDV